jgi:hypothetical protein
MLTTHISILFSIYIYIDDEITAIHMYFYSFFIERKRIRREKTHKMTRNAVVIASPSLENYEILFFFIKCLRQKEKNT